MRGLVFSQALERRRANPKRWKLMKADVQSGDGNVRRHARRFILKPFKRVCGLLLRTILTSLVFYAVIFVALHALGYPVPRISEMGRYFKGLSDLAKILS